MTDANKKEDGVSCRAALGQKIWTAFSAEALEAKERAWLLRPR